MVWSSLCLESRCLESRELRRRSTCIDHWSQSKCLKTQNCKLQTFDPKGSEKFRISFFVSVSECLWQKYTSTKEKIWHKKTFLVLFLNSTYCSDYNCHEKCLIKCKPLKNIYKWTSPSLNFEIQFKTRIRTFLPHIFFFIFKTCWIQNWMPHWVFSKNGLSLQF